MRKASALLLACLAYLNSTALAQPTTPTSFGRFGFTNSNGLLTVDVNANGFASPRFCAPMHVTFGNGNATAKVLRINATEKVLAISGHGGAPSEIRYTLLYPGFSARFGSNLTLHITGEGTKGLAPDTVAQNALLIRPTQHRGQPIELVFEKGAVPEIAKWDETSSGTSISIHDATGVGTVRFVTPIGIREVSELSSAAEIDQLRAEARRWADFPIPTLLSTSATTDAAGRLNVTETFRTEFGPPAVPIPPVIAFARRSGYPVRIEEPIVSTGCTTKWGAFTYAKARILRYSLPPPIAEERGYVRLDGGHADEAAPLLNELASSRAQLDGLPNSRADLITETPALMAWAYLSHAARESSIKRVRTALRDIWAKDNVRLGTSWAAFAEPYTHRTLYAAAAKPEKVSTDDQLWMSLVTLYDTHKYAEYTGDWETIRDCWPQIRSASEIVDAAMDWATLSVLPRSQERSALGDLLNASYCASLAVSRMGAICGDRLTADRFRLLGARLAVAITARLSYTDWAASKGVISSGTAARVFDHKAGFFDTRLGEDDPWYVTQLVSAAGASPELMNLYFKYAKDPLRKLEDRYAVAYRDWWQAGVPYAFRTCHQGNSVFVTFPHIFARSMLGEDEDRLWEYVAQAEPNRCNAWIGPNVIAELLSRKSPLILTEWQPAAYRDGRVIEDGHAQLSFAAAHPTDWRLTARCTGSTPERAQLNGRAVPFSYARGRLTISAQVQGKFTVEIWFKPAGSLNGGQ